MNKKVMELGSLENPLPLKAVPIYTNHIFNEYKDIIKVKGFGGSNPPSTINYGSVAQSGRASALVSQKIVGSNPARTIQMRKAKLVKNVCGKFLILVGS